MRTRWSLQRVHEGIHQVDIKDSKIRPEFWFELSCCNFEFIESMDIKLIGKRLQNNA